MLGRLGTKFVGHARAGLDTPVQSQIFHQLLKKKKTDPADGVGIRSDLFCIQEGAEFRLMVLQQEPE